MKKYATLPLCALFLSLVFLACEKVSFTVEQSSRLTPEQQFERLDKPPVLYQFASLRLDSGEEEGWIIDQAGTVKTYRRTLSPGALPAAEPEILTEAEVTDFHALSSETVGDIDLAELLQRFRQSHGLRPDAMSVPRVHQHEPRVNALYAYTVYTQNSAYDNQDWCKNQAEEAPHNQVGKRYARLVLNLSGYIERRDPSPAAVELRDWLREVDESLLR